MSLMPEGHCFSWTPSLLVPLVVADSIIAAAYFSIPLSIARVVRGRPEGRPWSVAWVFGGFIIACGLTHVLDVLTVWYADYALQAVVEFVTAILSIITAVILWRLVPSILDIPSVSQLQAVIASLEAEAGKRRRAEDELLDSEVSLALTLASIGAGFIATDRAGRITHMNAVAEKITGWSEGCARGENFWEVFVREDRPAAYRSINPVDLLIEDGVTINSAYYVNVLSRDASRVAVEVQLDLLRAADGQVRGLVSIFRDTSLLLRAEAEAKRLAAIVASSSDAIISNDLDGRITTWNEGAQQLFGYSSEEAIGRPISILIPPDRHHEDRRVVAELSAGRRVTTFDTLRLDNQSRLREVSMTVSPVRNPQGILIGISLAARDVSQQRSAEAALRASEARLRFAMEAARIGEWELDLVTDQIRHSLLHARCFGYDSLIPNWTIQRFLDHVHAEDRVHAEHFVEQAEKKLADLNFRCRVVWPDQTVHWVNVHGSVLRDAGVPVRVVGITMDISEQKIAEESWHKTLRLEAENKQIQESSRMKSLFLANMSHELRTPLNAIIGFADLLHAGAVGAGSAKHQEFLGYIGTSGRHLLQLINDVLDLSKVEAGKLEFHAERISLALLVEEVRAVLHAAIQQKQVSIEVDLDPNVTDVVLDQHRLKQVLYNYLSNAIKFTHEAGHVVIRVRPQGPRHFRLEVEDDGIGISPADIPRLFSEFQQLDPGFNRQHAGTGLGLALTRRLVEAQGGTVGVRSVLGKGSVFSLTLNRVHGDDVPRGGAVTSVRN